MHRNTAAATSGPAHAGRSRGGAGRSRAIPIALALVVALLAPPRASAQEDFGDAPDGTALSYPGMPGALGKFPTIAFTTNSRFPGHLGIHHDVVNLIWLGGATSATTTETSPNLTDLDVDDSGAFWYIGLTGLPASASGEVPVSLAPTAPPGPHYLNVLVDQNNDGEWKDLPGIREWVVRDLLIDQPPGRTRLYGFGLPWSSSVLLTPKWVRITVSSVPLMTAVPWGSDGWDGSMPPVPAGSPPFFSVGETEDRFVGDVYPGTAGPGGGPPAGPPGGGFPGGIGGGALGKGIPGGGGGGGAGKGGRCVMSISCQPRQLVIPCGQTRTVTCRVRFLSGKCPDLPGNPGCNMQVSPRFQKRIRGTGPRATVAPNPQCAKVGPGSRTHVFSFTVSFPPPCDVQNPRRERWRFPLVHDPDGLYTETGADALEGMELAETPDTCGNFMVNPPHESCDDGNLASGDGCGADCKFESYVPNGVLGPGEECDDGNLIPGDGCGAMGLREYCGNGRLDPHEGCDDGNATSGDGCSELCQPESPGSCGNGAVDHAFEQCDDGNLADGDGCDANCQTELCGDQSLDAGEQCDDGNTAGGDGCGPTCQSEGACGNGWLDAGEECDDGNAHEDDGCSSGCVIVPVPVRDLRFAADAGTLTWGGVVDPLRAYDIHRGLISELRATGSYDAAGSSCLARAHPTERFEDTGLPAPGDGYYYMIRVRPAWFPLATYDPAPPAGGYPGGRDASAVCN